MGARHWGHLLSPLTGGSSACLASAWCGLGATRPWGQRLSCWLCSPRGQPLPRLQQPQTHRTGEVLATWEEEGCSQKPQRWWVRSFVWPAEVIRLHLQAQSVIVTTQPG